MGATNIEDRSKATNHGLDQTPIKFEACQRLPNGGVLFLLPFLAETGLFSFRGHYEELKKGYYYINLIVLLLAFMSESEENEFYYIDGHIIFLCHRQCQRKITISHIKRNNPQVDRRHPM